MDPRERFQDLRVAVSAALDGRQAQIWTCLPAFIVSYDAVRQTCQVQCTIGIQTIDPLSNTSNPIIINIPVINDCPVVFPHGGGFSLTFPILPNDECLLHVSSRCIDGWWGQGGIVQQGDLRMHDLSDCFVMVGPRSLPNVLSAVSTSTVQLRSDDGQAYIEIAGGHVVNIVTPSDVNITAGGSIKLQAGAGIDMTAATDIDLTAPSLDVVAATVFTGTVRANGHPIDETHLHTEVQTGGDLSGPVA
jgi:hypothetical protein